MSKRRKKARERKPNGVKPTAKAMPQQLSGELKGPFFGLKRIETVKGGKIELAWFMEIGGNRIAIGSSDALVMEMQRLNDSRVVVETRPQATGSALLFDHRNAPLMAR